MADTAAPTAAPDTADTIAYRDAQAAEYGQYVALVPIAFNGATAYLAGDPVPASNVARHKYDDKQVAKIDNKAGKEAIAALHAANAAATEVVEQPPAVSLGVPVADGK